MFFKVFEVARGLQKNLYILVGYAVFGIIQKH